MPPLRSKRDPLIKWVEANAGFTAKLCNLVWYFQYNCYLDRTVCSRLLIILGKTAFQKHLHENFRDQMGKREE